MDTKNSIPAEKIALARVIAIVGSGAALGAYLGITKGAVSQWKKPDRKVPAAFCSAIERLVKRQVTCEELRPDVYLRSTTPTPTKAER